MRTRPFALLRVTETHEGLSIISVVFTMLLLGAIGLTIISLFVTDSSTAIMDTSALQAHYIAIGGMERSRGYLELEGNSNWPRNDTDPTFTSESLGIGSFTVISEYAATYLAKSMNSSDTTAEVNATTGFPATGIIKIDNEYMTYTGLGASPVSFTGLTRGASGSTATGHSKNKAVLITTLLNGAITAAATTLTVDSTSKFLGRGGIVTSADGGGGIIQIDSEQINYATTTTTTFAGCERGVNSTTAAAHSDNAPVFALANQCVVKSTGTVGTAGAMTYGQRVFVETIKE